jgi:hypothetical protein
MAEAAVQIKDQDLHSEFVAGSRTIFQTQTQRNDSRDRVETRLDTRSIRHLRLDPEIESDVSVLADSVFSDGLQIIPAVIDKEDAEYQEATDIADFMQKAISETRRPIESVLKEMFKSAFYYGVKVGEIVLRYQQDARIDGKLVLDRVNPKPGYATAFVTDKFYNVLGLVGARRPGEIVQTGTASLAADEIIPREKFLVFAFELEDNDPRGLSQVRALVEPYCDKQLTREQWKEWRRTSAIPKKIGITPQSGKMVAVKNADGTPKMTDGVQDTITQERALMNALENFANNSAVTAPFGTTIQQLEVNGTGVQFERHFKSCNIEMRKVILGDSLATGEADKDARAARESAKDVIDMRKQAIRVVIGDAIERDIFRLLTVVNFGPDKAHLTPKCFLGDTEATDWAGDLQAASQAGYLFAPEHMGQLDAQFGLEPRSTDAQQPNNSGQPNDGQTTQNTESIQPNQSAQDQGGNQ